MLRFSGVLQKGAKLTEGGLIDWVAERVTPYKKVRAVTFLDEIPKNPTGKILRKDLRLIPSTRRFAPAVGHCSRSRSGPRADIGRNHIKMAAISFVKTCDISHN